MANLLPRELADVVRAKMQSLKRKVVLGTVSKELKGSSVGRARSLLDQTCTFRIEIEDR